LKEIGLASEAVWIMTTEDHVFWI